MYMLKLKKILPMLAVFAFLFTGVSYAFNVAVCGSDAYLCSKGHYHNIKVGIFPGPLTSDCSSISTIAGTSNVIVQQDCRNHGKGTAMFGTVSTI